MKQIFKENDKEYSFEEFIWYMGSQKDLKGYTWKCVAAIINAAFEVNKSADYYRKKFASMQSINDIDEYIEEKSERMKLSDVLVQTNANIRRLSREETIKEIAKEAAITISKSCPLLTDLERFPFIASPSDGNIGILQLSDWHYGIDIDSYYNEYNQQIAKDRLSDLLVQVIKIVKEQKLKKLIVVNLGDLIAGRIHLTIRFNSRIDVITQTIEVSELLAEFIDELSTYVPIDYYSVIDNHSRLEPNKKEALQLESLARITDWYLIERLKDNDFVFIGNNKYGLDITTFNVFGWRFAGVHGDLDKLNTVVKNVSLMTRQNYDVILTSHLHHLTIDEENKTIVVSNPSLMGTDDLAEKMRKNSYAAQNLIIVSENNPVYMLCRLVVN